MRTTISIPDEYYERLKPRLKEEGYATVNELVLDLLRHHVEKNPHQFDAPIVLAKNERIVKSPKFKPNALSEEVPKVVIKTPEDAQRVVSSMPFRGGFSKETQAKGRM